MQTAFANQTSRYSVTDNDAAMLRLHQAGWPVERIGEQFHASVDAVRQAVGRASLHQPETLRSALNSMRRERLRAISPQ